MFRHVLVPTDGSPTALNYGEGLGIDALTLQEFERAAREAGERHVGAVTKLAKAARVPFASLVASHGRRGFSRLMMGSVTQRVLLHATVPVLVFRG